MIPLKSKNIPQQPRNKKYGVVGASNISRDFVGQGEPQGDLKLQLEQYRKELSNIIADIAKSYLSKLGDDSASGLITFLQGVIIGSYAPGATGGYIDGTGSAEFKDLNIRDFAEITGNLKVSGDTVLSKTLEVVRDAVMKAGLTVAKNAKIDGTLGVGGKGTFENGIDVTGVATVKGKVVAQNGIGDAEISSSIAGWNIGYDEQGNSVLDVDKLNVRLEAIFRELIVEKYTHVGGGRIASCAGIKCTKVIELGIGGGRYNCYFDTGDNGEVVNQFEVDDLAICQIFSGAKQKYYWRRVVGVGPNFIVLSKTDCDGEGIPEAGDSIIQLGNKTKASRQNAIIERTFGTTSYVQYRGINSYSLAGRDVTVISPDGNSFTGDFIIENTGENVAQQLAITKNAITILQSWNEEVNSSIYYLNLSVNGLQSTVTETNTRVDALGGRVTTAESEIIQNARNIALKVWQSEYDDDLLKITEKINTVQKSADTANSAIASMNDDLIFDVNEKQVIRIEWEKITGQGGSYPQTVAMAGSVGVDVASLVDQFDLLYAHLYDIGLYMSGNSVGFSRATLSERFAKYYAAEKSCWDKISNMRVECNNICYMTNSGVQGWSASSEIELAHVIRANGEAFEIEIVEQNVGGWCVAFFENLDLKQFIPGKPYTIGFDVWANNTGGTINLGFGVCERTALNQIIGTQNKTILANGIYHHVTLTGVATNAPVANQVLYIAGFGTYGRILRIKNVMIVAGDVDRAYRPALSDQVEKNLLPTGIDIRHKQITITADNTTFLDNNGNKIAVFTKEGINANLINTKELRVERLICYNKNGEKLYSVNETNDGCPKFYYPNGVVMKEDVFVYDEFGNVSGLETRYYDSSGKLKWKTSEAGTIVIETDITSIWHVMNTYYLPEPPTAEEVAYLKQIPPIDSNITLSKFNTTEYNEDIMLEVNYNDRICIGAKSNQNPTSIPANQWVTGYVLEDKTNYRGDDIWHNPPIIALRERFLRRYENGKHISSGDIFIK